MFRYAIFLGVSLQYVCLRMSNTITYFVWIAFYSLVMLRNDVVCQLISNCAAYNIIIIIFQIFCLILCRVIVIATMTRCFKTTIIPLDVFTIYCVVRARTHVHTYTLTLYTGTWLYDITSHTFWIVSNHFYLKIM